jgi:hypothetical protein
MSYHDIPSSGSHVQWGAMFHFILRIDIRSSLYQKRYYLCPSLAVMRITHAI